MKKLQPFLIIWLCWCNVLHLTAQGIPPACPFPTPSESCESACISCDALNGYMGSSAGWAADPTPPGWCSQIQNDQWFAFVAGTAGATFTITPSNCTNGDGLQFALYQDCGLSGPIACDAGFQGGGTTPLSLSTILNIGQTYYLIVDGFSQDYCDFSINVSPPQAALAVPLGPVGNISGPSSVCTGGTFTYSIPAVSGAGFYTWSSNNPDVLFNGLPGPVDFAAPGGRTVLVSFPYEIGNVTVSVQPSNGCSTGTLKSKTINVINLPPTILPAAIVCNEDLPYTTPWGDEVSTTGTYSTTLYSANGCDSLVRQQVIVLPPIQTNRTVYLCQGETLTVCNTVLATQGIHVRTCESFRGCDSTVTTTLNYMNPVAQITGNTVIGCEMNSISLGSLPSTMFPVPSVKTWTRPDGTTSAGNTLSNITEPGQYILRTTQSAGSKICEVSDTVMVTRDSSYIPVTTTSGALGCQNTPTFVTLSANTSVTNPMYVWSGPNGFSSIVQSPVVNTAGIYTVTVTTVAGCSGIATAVVTSGGAGGQPSLSVTGGGILTCTTTSVILGATSTSTGVTYLWNGPAGFTSMTQSPVVNIAGTYTVVVTNTVGCTNSASVVVSSNTTLPPLTGIDISSNNCLPPYTLTPLGVTPNFLYNWSGPNGQSFTTRQITTTVPGTYTVTVTNPVNGCTKTATITTDSLVLPIVTGTVSQPTNGNSNGSIDISLNLPAGSYTYTWSQNGTPLPVGTPFALVNIGPGTYSLLVTTNSGCTTTRTYVLTNIETPDIQLCPNSQYSAVESCGEVLCVPCDLNGYQGSNANFEADLPPTDFCSQIQNDLWHAFVAGSDTMTLTITSSNCVTGDGLQFAIYPASCQASPIACNTGCAGCQGSYSQTVTGMVPGEAYFLVIDGYSQDVCDYSIQASPTNALSGGIIPLAAPAAISGPLTICVGNTKNYTVPAVSGATGYIWSAPSGVLLNGQASTITTVNPTVAMSTLPGVADTVSLCVKAVSACQISAETCLKIRSFAPIMQVLPPVAVCAANLPYTLPWGISVATAGVYSNTFASVNGCDSTVTVEVSILDPSAEITGNATIGCGMTSVTLGASTTPGAGIQWLIDGTVAGNGSELTVSLPAEVVLVAALTQGSTTCSAFDTIGVELDNSVLVVNATGGVVGCNISSVTLTAATSGVNGALQYAWSGPDNFMSAEASPTVTAAGVYTVTVTDPLNGCSGVATATVVAATLPIIEVLGPPVLTCSQTEVVLLPNANPAYTYQWTGPNGFQSTEPAPVTSMPGVYLVTATNAFGCTATRTIIVSQNINTPDLLVNQQTQACVGVVQLSAFSVAPNVQYLWTDPLGATTEGSTVVVTMSGVYTLTATNLSNGCTSTQAVSVVHNTNPSPIMISSAFVNPTSGNNGSILVVISGATPPYTTEWTLDGAPFSSQASISNLGPGDYVLTVTDTLGCTVTATFTLEPVSTNDPAISSMFTVQPNPNDGLFYLNSTNDSQPIERLLVYDAIGRQVWFQTAVPAGNKYLIDLSNQPSGIYLLEITLVHGQRIVKKVMVE